MSGEELVVEVEFEDVEGFGFISVEIVLCDGVRFRVVCAVLGEPVLPIIIVALGSLKSYL